MSGTGTGWYTVRVQDPLDTSIGPNPLYVRLADQLRRQIVDGVVDDGSVLPSIRDLMAAHGIARDTVVSAYELLESQGYVKTEARRGTFAIRDPAVHARMRIRKAYTAIHTLLDKLRTEYTDAELAGALRENLRVIDHH